MTEIKKIIQPKQPVFKVIPLAFDESMSYYECICKLTNKMNEIIAFCNNVLSKEVTDYINEKFNEIMLNAMYDSETETLVLYLENNNE